MKDAIKNATAAVIGVSPIIGDSAISGPAHKLMAAQGWEPSAFGVAKLYSDFVDTLLIDSADEMLREKIQSLGIKVVATPIRIDSNSEKRRLAREVLALVEK